MAEGDGVIQLLDEKVKQSVVTVSRLRQPRDEQADSHEAVKSSDVETL